MFRRINVGFLTVNGIFPFLQLVSSCFDRRPATSFHRLLGSFGVISRKHRVTRAGVPHDPKDRDGYVFPTLRILFSTATRYVA